jgi:hypothetical protein
MSTDASKPVALAVDLDGTLVRSDLFMESLLTLIRRSPLSVFWILLWAFSGRAGLKRRISERVSIEPVALPYLEEVLQFVRAEQAAGRHTVLATGSDRKLVQPVADYLGCFDAVIASDGCENRTGRSKERQLTASYGEAGFDYIGNSLVDLPVWRSARHALLAARNRYQGRKLEQRLPFEQVFYYPHASWGQWARLLHLRQWGWNLLVFAPLVLIDSGPGESAWVAASVAFLALNLCSSGLLLGVDLLNVSTDRQHPKNSEMPLPSGQIYLPSALLLAPVLLLASLALPLFLLSHFLLVLMLYGLLQLVPSLWEDARLTAVPAQALLCLLRLFCGGIVAGIPADAWLEILPL